MLVGLELFLGDLDQKKTGGNETKSKAGIDIGIGVRAGEEGGGGGCCPPKILGNSGFMGQQEKFGQISFRVFFERHMIE